MKKNSIIIFLFSFVICSCQDNKMDQHIKEQKSVDSTEVRPLIDTFASNMEWKEFRRHGEYDGDNCWEYIVSYMKYP